MPQALAIIPVLLGAFGAAESIKSLVDKPGAPKTPAPNPQQVQADALKTRNTQEAAITQALPGLQAQTGGSLSPETLLQLAKVVSGQAGNAGIDAATQDLLQKMTSGGQNGPQVTTGSGLTSGGSVGG